MHKPGQSARIRRQALTGWHLWPHIQFFNSRSSLEMSVREVSSAAAAWIFKRKVSQRFSALHDIDVSTSRHLKCIFVGVARQACKDIFLLRMGSPGHRDQTFFLLVACQATQPSYHSIFASAATLSAYYAEARDLYRSQNRSWAAAGRWRGIQSIIVNSKVGLYRLLKPWTGAGQEGRWRRRDRNQRSVRDRLMQFRDTAIGERKPRKKREDSRCEKGERVCKIDIRTWTE